MVEVRIFGPLWEHLEPSLELELEPSQELDRGGHEITVADLLARLGIDSAEVGIVTVDRRQSNLDEIIPADGRVCIFPPMSGG
jgi:molybdopterin converting factor small subunit